jgi:phosphomannomutase
MKYYVTYKIDARYVVEVEADNLEEARKKAEEEYIDADFGVAEDIDGEDIIVEDENGNYIWER